MSTSFNASTLDPKLEQVGADLLKMKKLKQSIANSFPVFSTSKAISLLWEKAAPVLDTQELEWFAYGAGQQVSFETNALADVLMELGSMVASDTESGSFQSGDSVSNLLFNLSSQMSALNGLAEIAADASYRVHQALKGQP